MLRPRIVKELLTNIKAIYVEPLNTQLERVYDLHMKDAIRQYLCRSRELTQLCTQNGWIENDSIEYETLAQSGSNITLAVAFDEVIMEGAGCIANRARCYGRMELMLAEDGQVVSGRVLAGIPS